MENSDLLKLINHLQHLGHFDIAEELLERSNQEILLDTLTNEVEGEK